MMDRGSRAVRQLQFGSVELATQEHLRATDPERYREHMRQIVDPQSPYSQIDRSQARLIGTFVYDPDAQTVTFERAEDTGK